MFIACRKQYTFHTFTQIFPSNERGVCRPSSCCVQTATIRHEPHLYQAIGNAARALLQRALFADEGPSNGAKVSSLRSRWETHWPNPSRQCSKFSPFCISRRGKTARIGTRHHRPMFAFANRLNKSGKSTLSLTTCPAASKLQAPSFKPTPQSRTQGTACTSSSESQVLR